MRSDGEGTRLALGPQDRSLQARLMASEAAMEELRLLRQRQETLVEEAKRKLPQELVRPAGCFNSSIDKLRNAVDHLKRTDSDLVGALHTLNTQILQLKLAEAAETDGENDMMSASCRSMSSSAVSIPSFTSSSRTSTLIDLPDSRRSSGFFDASSPSPPLTPDIASPEKLHHYEEVDGRVSTGWPDEIIREPAPITNSQFYNRHSFGESDSVASNDAKQSYFSGLMPVQSQAPREEKKKEDSLSRRFKLALRPRSKTGLSVCYPYPSPMHAIAIQSDMYVPADSESVVEEEHSSCVDARSGHNQSTNRPEVVTDAQAVSLTGVPADDKFAKAPPGEKNAGLLRPVSTPPDISRVWNGEVLQTKNSEQTTEQLVDIPDYENIFSAYSELPGNDIAPRRHSFAGSRAQKQHVEDAIPNYENLSNLDNDYGDYVTLTPEDLSQIPRATTARPTSEAYSDSGVKTVPATSENVSRPEVHQERKAPRKPKPTPRQSLLKKANPTVTPPLPQPREEPQVDTSNVNVKATPVSETPSNKTTSQENTSSKTAQPGPALLMASLIADGKVNGLTDVKLSPTKDKDKSALTKIVGKYSPRKQIQAHTESKTRGTTNTEKTTLQEKAKSEHNSPRRKEQPQPDSNNSHNAKTVRMKFRAPPGVDIRPRHCNENSHVRSTKTPSEPNTNREESREQTTSPSSVSNKPRQPKSEGRNSPCRKLQFQQDSKRMSAQSGQVPPGHNVPRGTEISAKRCSAQASTRRLSKDAPLPESPATPVYGPGNDKCPAPTEFRLSQPVVANHRPGRVPHSERYWTTGELRQQVASLNSGYAKKDESSRRYKRHDGHKDSRKTHGDKRSARRHTTAVNTPAHMPPMNGGLADYRSRHSHSSTSLNGHPMSKLPSNVPHGHRVPHAFSRGVRGLKKAGQSRSTSRLYDYDTSVLGSSSEESSSSDSEINRSDSESDSESSDEAGGLVLAKAKWPAVVGTATRRRLSSQDSLSRMFPSCHLVTEL